MESGHEEEEEVAPMASVAPTAPTFRSSLGSDTYSIPAILSLAESGQLRIPQFQRAFVWDASDVRKLFDSIYRGFPIGTLLLWSHHVPKETVRLGNLVVEAPATDGLIVVDGQQRVTSLVSALGPAPVTDERFHVYFDLARRTFVGANRGLAPPRSIPVNVALESKTLLTWLREHSETLEDSDFALADELAGALRDYRVPAYVVGGEDERLLRDVFDRVNSAGKPISRAQIFHALFANDTQPGSPASVVKELASTGFGEIPENRVVQSLLGIRGGDVARDVHDEFAEDEDPADWYEQTERALQASVRFLRSEGVVHQLLVPSSFPIPVLATFFHLHPDPLPVVRKMLSRWLWRGWVHGFGRESGQTPTLRRAIRSINPKKGLPNLAPDEFEAARLLLEPVRDERVDSLGIATFRTDNADARMALLALVDLTPLTPEGDVLDVARALEEFGVDAVGDLVQGNRSATGARGFWLPGWPSLTGRESPNVLESHAVSEEAARALRMKDIGRFLALRAATVERAALTRLNSKMEPGLEPRPPIARLLVPDPS